MVLVLVVIMSSVEGNFILILQAVTDDIGRVDEELGEGFVEG
jgi:hypothetical protein